MRPRPERTLEPALPAAAPATPENTGGVTATGGTTASTGGMTATGGAMTTGTGGTTVSTGGSPGTGGAMVMIDAGMDPPPAMGGKALLVTGTIPSSAPT